MGLTEKLETLPTQPGCLPLQGRGRGRSSTWARPACCGTACAPTSRPAAPWTPAAATCGRDRRPRPRGHRHRDRGARPREQLHQAPPPALQRPAAGRQEPPLPEAHAGRGVPAAPRGAAGGRRTATPTAGPTSRRAWAGDRGPHAQGLRHPLLQGDAERTPRAALPAVPDQALPRALRGRGLLAAALPPGVRGRAPVPRGTHGRGA